MRGPINIAIAEDHKLFRQGIVGLLNETERINVLFDAENGRDLLEKLQEQHPDVILLDIRMPEIDGQQALQLIRQQYPGIKIIMLSMHYSDEYIVSFMAAGASAFLPKNCSIEKVEEAIVAVHQRGYYYDDKTTPLIHTELVKARKPATDNAYTQLTERETAIVKLICAEKTAVEIGNELFISTRTVEWHKNNIFQKTGAKSLVGLALYAIRAGIIPNPEDLFN